MDGFEPGTDVIVLGATNRPEILDPALLRPAASIVASQSTRRIEKGRVRSSRSTLGVALADDVDLERIAASIPGSTGADIALLVNEAAIFAARREHSKVEQRDFTDAIEKILLGAERQVVMTDADAGARPTRGGPRAGGMLTPGADPVRKISIIPRGQALGVTLSTPDSDRYNYRREELLAQIRLRSRPRSGEGRLGRALDRRGVGYPEPHPGRPRMVGRWGMSDAVGPVAVTDGRSDGLLLPGAMPASEPTQELVDKRSAGSWMRPRTKSSSCFSKSETDLSGSPRRCSCGRRWTSRGLRRRRRATARSGARRAGPTATPATGRS